MKHKPKTFYRGGKRVLPRDHPCKDNLTVVASFTDKDGVCITAWNRGAYHFTRKQAEALIADLQAVLR